MIFDGCSIIMPFSFVCLHSCEQLTKSRAFGQTAADQICMQRKQGHLRRIYWIGWLWRLKLWWLLTREAETGQSIWILHASCDVPHNMSVERSHEESHSLVYLTYTFVTLAQACKPRPTISNPTFPAPVMSLSTATLHNFFPAVC